MSTSKPRYPSIPRVKGQGRDIAALSQSVETLTGVRGNGLDKAVTRRELIETGAFILRNSTGGGSLVVPPPSPGDVVTPTLPVGVIATGGFSFILVEWDAPSFSGFAYAEVWRGVVDDYGFATLIATTTASMYADVTVGLSAGYYYWIRFVNTNDIAGPIHDTHGAYAETAVDIEGLIAALEGQLTESQFAEVLNERIDLIDGAESIAGSVAQRIAAARDALQLDIDANGAAIATEASTRETADSALATSISTISASVASNATAIATESTARSSADSAMASQITTLFSASGTNAAAISSEATTRSSADAALASEISTLDAQVGENAAAIVAESNARADADDALASDITSLYAASGSNSAAITAEATTRASADSAMASNITTLQSTVGGHTASISTLSTVQGGIAAQQFVKLDVNGYVVGYGAYNAGPGLSGFVVHADLFAVGKPGQTTGYPFIVGTVDGVTRIVLNGASYLSDSTITTAKINNAAITTAKILDAAISTAKIADLAVASAKIADLAVTNTKIGNASISSAKIEDLAVTSAKIGNLAVDTLKIADNAVTVPQYSSGSGGTITTSWATAVSITVNWGANIPSGIMLIGSVNCQAAGSGNETLAIRFRQGSTGSTDGDVGVSAASGFSVSLTGTAGFVPASATETYYLEVKKTFGATYTQGSKNLLLLGIKK